jgi:DNA-binding MarR family transcriptional regulator
MPTDSNPGDDDYRRLLAFRTGLRRFLHRSDVQARTAGLTSSQHQLLLAVRGHPRLPGPTITEASDYMLITHNAAVQLVDRAQAAGLVERTADPDNYRVVRLRLTETGAERLRALSTLHLEELALLEPTMRTLWNHTGEQAGAEPRAANQRVNQWAVESAGPGGSDQGARTRL